MLDIASTQLYRQVHPGKVDNWKVEAVMDHLMGVPIEDLHMASVYKSDAVLAERMPLMSEYLELKEELKSLSSEEDYTSALQEGRIDEIETRKFELESEMGAYRSDLMDFAYCVERVRPRVHTIEFTIDEVMDAYWDYFGTNRRHQRFRALIKETSKATFSFDGFPVRALIDPNAVEIKEAKGKKTYKGGQIYNEYIPIPRSNFFDCVLDGRQCHIQFRTLLGILFSHNILTLNTDWLPKEFLKLNTNAAALYRRFFSVVPRNQPRRLRVKDVFEHFGYPVGGNNDKHLEYITKWLKDLIKVGLLAGFEVELRRGKIEYARIHLSYDTVEKAVESVATYEDISDEIVQTI
jgi:hypothetical protein